jgi:hypothetical protein
MAALTTQEVTQAGTTLAFAACAGGGDTFINDGKLILNLKQQGVEDPLDSRRELDLETASEQ